MSTDNDTTPNIVNYTLAAHPNLVTFVRELESMQDELVAVPVGGTIDKPIAIIIAVFSGDDVDNRLSAAEKLPAWIDAYVSFMETADISVDFPILEGATGVVKLVIEPQGDNTNECILFDHGMIHIAQAAARHFDATPYCAKCKERIEIDTLKVTENILDSTIETMTDVLPSNTMQVLALSIATDGVHFSTQSCVEDPQHSRDMLVGALKAVLQQIESAPLPERPAPKLHVVKGDVN